MADKKALFRAKLAQRKEKRIESPLVRYNELEQPVCRVCDVILKSETDWTVHQASRKHNAAINNLKANAAALKQTKNLKPGLSKDLPKPEPENHEELHNKEAEPAGLSKRRQSSSLPPNFFDSKETKKQKSVTAQTEELQPPISRSKVDIANENVDSKISELGPSREQLAKQSLGSEARKAKGVLPEGFYDNKDADLRARGIAPVKPDVKDEYKEFEKLIQEDLQEVDKRLEEEEYDAADMIEEAETVEQRAYRERVERLRKRKMELKAAKSTIRGKDTQITNKESSDEESSSDVDSDENLTVDWRAKHL
ncbi:zinc finger protein 830-like [Ipomoea triloba]|uniref:zinc finger protein 830-like n=1 Tax=Ipomoea triloba TaxID=35885 RepID=UPI00125E1B7D|nr:zinc finger protein 830-like [Ipomoea triloba]XP_031107384.1 zinc finger protein 830-like [Ipomoea triloba]